MRSIIASVSIGVGIIGLTVPGAAAACAVVVPAIEQTPAAEWRRARAAVAEAVVIVDAEVVRPFIAGKQAAILKAYKVHKGPAQETYEVDSPTSCNREFDVEGERVRVLLRGGPSVYFESDPGLGWQVDKLIGSDRRRDWPYRAASKEAVP